MAHAHYETSATHSIPGRAQIRGGDDGPHHLKFEVSFGEFRAATREISKGTVIAVLQSWSFPMVPVFRILQFLAPTAFLLAGAGMVQAQDQQPPDPVSLTTTTTATAAAGARLVPLSNVGATTLSAVTPTATGTVTAAAKVASLPLLAATFYFSSAEGSQVGAGEWLADTGIAYRNVYSEPGFQLVLPDNPATPDLIDPIMFDAKPSRLPEGRYQAPDGTPIHTVYTAAGYWHGEEFLQLKDPVLIAWEGGGTLYRAPYHGPRALPPEPEPASAYPSWLPQSLVGFWTLGQMVAYIDWDEQGRIKEELIDKPRITPIAEPPEPMPGSVPPEVITVDEAYPDQSELNAELLKLPGFSPVPDDIKRIMESPWTAQEVPDFPPLPSGTAESMYDAAFNRVARLAEDQALRTQRMEAYLAQIEAETGYRASTWTAPQGTRLYIGRSFPGATPQLNEGEILLIESDGRMAKVGAVEWGGVKDFWGDTWPTDEFQLDARVPPMPEVAQGGPAEGIPLATPEQMAILERYGMTLDTPLYRATEAEYVVDGADGSTSLRVHPMAFGWAMDEFGLVPDHGGKYEYALPTDKLETRRFVEGSFRVGETVDALNFTANLELAQYLATNKPGKVVVETTVREALQQGFTILADAAQHSPVHLEWYDGGRGGVFLVPLAEPSGETATLSARPVVDEP